MHLIFIGFFASRHRELDTIFELIFLVSFLPTNEILGI